MTKHYRNHNIRFNMTDEGGVQAWERLHSAEVEQDFKSQNAFVVAAINDYYERHLAKKNDPYLESREKEDALQTDWCRLWSRSFFQIFRHLQPCIRCNSRHFFRRDCRLVG